MTPETIAAQISSLIDQKRDALIADTQRLIQFRTISGGTGAEEEEFQREVAACFAWLEELATRMGFAFRLIEGVVGEITWQHPDPDAPLMMIAGHIDVVSVGGDWTHPPFSGEIVEGELWGRGTQDDKGPVMQALYGLYAVKESGIVLPCSVRVVIGTQEETGDWTDIALYLENAPMPDYAFTPDADFPIINGEKGMLSVIVGADWPNEGLDEETGLEFVSLVGGERDNIVPRLCELTIRFPKEHRSDVMKELVRTTTQYVVDHEGANVTLQPNREREIGPDRFESAVSFLGKAAHASTPAEGHNAIVDALDFIRDIETLPLTLRKFAAFAYLAGSDTTGANLGIDATHDFIGDTTVCLAIAEIRPTGGRAVLNIRPTMGSITANVVAKMKQLAEQYSQQLGVEITVEQKGKALDAIFLDPENPKVAPFIQSLRQGFELVTGRPAKLKAVGGTTYAKAFPNCCAFGPILTPDEPSIIHQPDERVPVESIIRNAKIYGTSIGLMACKE